MFEAIKTIFDVHRAELEFGAENEINNFKIEKGETIEYEPLDTSILKLRRKNTSIKAEWRKLGGIVKKGSGLSPKREPKWYKILNPIFTETNEPLELASGIEDTSFSLETLEGVKEEDEVDVDEEEDEGDVEEEEDEGDVEEEDEGDVEEDEGAVEEEEDEGDVEEKYEGDVGGRKTKET